MTEHSRTRMARAASGRTREDLEDNGDFDEMVDRRVGSSQTHDERMRLQVVEHLLDRSVFAYRFINSDDPVRFHRLTVLDNWTVVANDGKAIKPDSTDLGDAVSYPVGVGPQGTPILAYLCRKPLKFHEASIEARQRALDAEMADLRAGRTSTGGRGAPSEAADYVPNEGIHIDA